MMPRAIGEMRLKPENLPPLRQEMHEFARKWGGNLSYLSNPVAREDECTRDIFLLSFST